MARRETVSTPAWRHWLLPAAVFVIALLLELWGDGGRLVARYSREGIAGGEVWRLVSGHLVHLGWSHFLMNVLAFAGIWLLVGASFSLRQWLLIFLLVIAGIDIGFWLFEPQLRWYVGLSGVLHGLLLAGLLASWRSRPAESALLGALLAAKLIYEQIHGPLPGSAATAGGAVVVNAHLYGAVAGVAACALWQVRVLAKRSI